MTSRVLMVGEDNPQSAAPEHALYNDPPGCAGWRLQRILGLDDEAYLGLGRTNLCVDLWLAPVARVRARQLLADAARLDVVILLGRRVAGAFSRAIEPRPKLDAFSSYPVPRAITTSTVTQMSTTWLVSLPHPSGRCQAWNNRNNVYRARIILQGVAPDLPWGSWSDKEARRVES